ncbi:J domain-containing protein required for chloroplast accumulation response 1 isoform X2 [Abrus precatorius]|uniref:J domain-containing protein required for chloroplast accumulation response 1 isoform X2 n=1 Tax=Abrus precatorius TaxID=3816 RepID=A0A8B8LGK1_ABRPR|nr:J domain-containing protein required for chloroplast accumulation response 1 isoform X2 [Abrus precatorius]
MERFYYSQRESVLLGYNYNNNKSLIERASSTNPSTPQRNWDVDFTDVFGGPPRRSSVNETRQSVSELEELRGEEGESGWCEKPVFGEDNGNRRRFPNKSNDFFYDIFGGEESPSVCSTPKKRVGESFTARVLSPARPLPPAADPVGFPVPFSLPAKLTNGVDLPTFGSPTRSRNPLDNIDDGIAGSNGLGSSDSHLSRFSTQCKELKNDLNPHFRQSLLSQESSNMSISDQADTGSNMKQQISISEVSRSTTNCEFHFSIYKWASKGVPLVMPFRTERASRTKEKVKLERCSSAKEWKINEITPQNPIANKGSSLLINRKQDVSTTSTATKKGADSHQIVEQILSAKAQSDTSSSPKTVTKEVPGSSTSCDDGAVESSTHSKTEIGFSGKTVTANQTQKLQPKQLHSLLKEDDEKQDCDEVIIRENEENKIKTTKKLSAIFDVAVNPKKQEEKVLLRDVGHSKASSEGSLNSGENMGKGRVKGKVKEFVRIFNQEAVTKPKVDFKSQLLGSIHKQRDALRTKIEVEGNHEQSKKDNSATETTNTFANNLSHQDDNSMSAIPDISFAVVGDKDEFFHGNFMIRVIAQDEGEILQNQETQEIQVIDNKIQQWSKGKEGNIRSLLSTLQYVLWPECGWKPVPLVDIIEGNAVKRAYQRALLCLHPDKLQQKGAASQQKYIAEKVFDILQEAWTQFNIFGVL